MFVVIDTEKTECGGIVHACESQEEAEAFLTTYLEGEMGCNPGLSVEDIVSNIQLQEVCVVCRPVPYHLTREFKVYASKE